MRRDPSFRCTRGAAVLMVRLAVVLVVCTFAVTACGRGKPTVATAGAAPTWPSFGSFPGPDRILPLMAWTGSRLLLVAGAEAEDTTPLGDAYSYEPGGGLWGPLPPVPSDPFLQVPAGVWTGEELIIVGVPCDSGFTDADAPRDCLDGDTRAFGLDEGGEWRPLPAAPRPEVRLGQRILPRAVGWTGEVAVFEIDGRLLLFDPSDDEWSSTPAPPFRPQLLCASPDGIVAADYLDAVTSTVVGEPGSRPGEVVRQTIPPLVVPVVTVSSFDTSTGQWGASASADVEGLAAPLIRILCSGSDVLVAPLRRSLAGSVPFFDASAADFGISSAPPVDIGATPLALDTGESVLVLAESGTLTYRRSDRSWTVLDERNWENAGVAVWAGDRAVVYDREPDEEPLVEYIP